MAVGATAPPLVNPLFTSTYDCFEKLDFLLKLGLAMADKCV